MAMSMQQEFVAEFFSSAFTLGGDVIDFNDIGVLKEQLAPTTFPLLFAQEHALDPIEHGMGFESLAPIEEIAIVGTGRSLDLDVLLDVRLSVFPQRCLLASEMPAHVLPPHASICSRSSALPCEGWRRLAHRRSCR